MDVFLADHARAPADAQPETGLAAVAAEAPEVGWGSDGVVRTQRLQHQRIFGVLEGAASLAAAKDAVDAIANRIPGNTIQDFAIGRQALPAGLAQACGMQAGTT